MKPSIVDVEGIEEGMLAADDIRSFDGTIILRKGSPIEGRHMRLFKRAMISQVRVIPPEKTEEQKKKLHINDYPNQLAVLKTARVLIVDDSKYLRFKLQKALTEAGLEVAGQAENGKEAVEKATALEPNVITLDIEMPNFDGLSALPALRKNLPHATIIMISSFGEEDKILEALAKGANDFIVKPIDPEKVKATIMDMIIIGRGY